MGIGRFLKTLVSPKAMAEEILRLQVDAYRAAEKIYPGADPHVLLAQVWLSRMAAARKVNPHDSSVQQRAFEQTWQFSIIPWPRNARALGLYFLQRERPDLVHAFPEYMQEFNEILAPGLAAMQSGEFFARYEETNPHVSYRPTKETGTGWLFELNVPETLPDSVPSMPSAELQEWLEAREKAIKARDAMRKAGGHMLIRGSVVNPEELPEPLRTEAIEYLRQRGKWYD